MAFSMAGGGPSGPQINVTPLIDVLLTLIIMFMLVVSMDKEYVEKAQIPQPPKQDAKSEPIVERTVVIELLWTAKDQPPKLKLNDENVDWWNLDERLAQIYLKRVEKVAFVRADADVDFQSVATVIDVAHHAGVQAPRTTHHEPTTGQRLKVSILSSWEPRRLRLSGSMHFAGRRPRPQAKPPAPSAAASRMHNAVRRWEFRSGIPCTSSSSDQPAPDPSACERPARSPGQRRRSRLPPQSAES